MMSPSEIVSNGALDERASTPEVSRRFKHLRGVQWRIDLGILPSSPSASVDDLRRVIADSRRRYAALRRQLLVDPHVSKEGSPSPDIFIDNPLSENPDSMWGRFFRNAELERMVDHDLTRLYPEHGSYFQTSECQSMLRRILLLWCLKHSEYGYRQGMHELLAPLLYVLHVDTQHLAAVRKIYDDYFIDNFDGFSFYENDFTYKYDSKKFSESMEDINAIGRSSPKPSSLYELDPEIQSIILLSDAYGAEGELGVALSEKFMEHDAYCLFEALMSGSGGVVAMAEFFSQSRFSGSHSGLPPVIEASAALYHLLSIVDSSLHTHLVELGVEPQYFALRWLRVLFGREFALEDLLVIWDEIFQCPNSKFHESSENGTDLSFGVLDSSRGAFISSFAVSMILYLRSSLLATENATTCLQRLLNFPNNVNLEKLILKAKSLQSLAAEANTSNPLFVRNKSRGHSLSVDLTSPNTPLNFVPHNYWEEKWRDFHKKEPKNEKKTPIPRRGWTEKVKLRLSRSDSAPSSSKDLDTKKDPRLVVRRSLLEDLSRQLGADEEEGTQKITTDEDLNENVEYGNNINEDSAVISGHTSLSGNPASEENSCIFSDPPSPIGEPSDRLDKSESSVCSSISVDENDAVGNNGADLCRINEDSTLSVSQSSEEVSSLLHEQNVDSTEKPVTTGSKEQKLLFSRFQRFWKFGRGGGGEGAGGMASEKARSSSSSSSSVANDASCSGETEQEENAENNGSKKYTVNAERETMVDQNVMLSLRTLGQSMLDNIQVIESAFQQDNKVQQAGSSSKSNNLVGKGQVTAMAALKELRKISNLLSEM